MKSIYEKPILTIEFFEEQDVLTTSNADGLGEIRDDWWMGA